MEELGYSVSDTILSPVYKRFNSSGPLITVFDPAEAVIVSTALVFAYNNVYTQKSRGEQFRVAFSIAQLPADLWNFDPINVLTGESMRICVDVCERSKKDTQREAPLYERFSRQTQVRGGPAEVEHFSLQKRMAQWAARAPH